jgi:hypothetical protein
MPSRTVMSMFLCAGLLLMGSQSFRIQGSSSQASKSDGIHDGPVSWWGKYRTVLRQFGAPWTGKFSVFDFMVLFSNLDEEERRSKGEPYLDDETKEHYKVFLRDLGTEGVKIEKLKRLQAGCEELHDDDKEELTRVFQWNTFESVAKLAKEFPTPQDLFSLMPERAAEAKEKWVYTYTSPNLTDFETSRKDFIAWQKERGLDDFKDVDRDKMLFNGLTIAEFAKLHPQPDESMFPVDIRYTQETETFHLALIDAVEEDWVTVSEQPVSRDAYVNHFLSKPEAKRLPSGGEQLLKEALEGAFDVCAQLTMPAATKLDEHAFRYCSALASDMFVNNMPSDDC